MLPISVVRYSCPAFVAKDRLELMGFTLDVALAGFKHGLSQEIAFYEKLAEKYRGGPLDYFNENLQVLRELDPESWLSGIKRILGERLERLPRSSELVNSKYSPLLTYMLANDRFGFPGHEYRHYIRLLLEVTSESEQLEYDLTDLALGGWLYDAEDLVTYADELLSSDFISTRRIIVLTEGHTDKWVMERSVNLLYPHLREYFHFFDFRSTKAAGGAGELTNTVKAFAAAGIANRIVALFDNDTAGESGIRALSNITMPSNIAIRKYPTIKLATNYPTLGPNGLVHMDVNGLAGSIELYLGRDVLEDENRDLTPVQWTGYNKGLNRYQGEILNKQELLSKFDKKVKTCESNPSRISSFDWEGIHNVLRVLRCAFHDMDASDILGN
jgi:hypothetical protein